MTGLEIAALAIAVAGAGAGVYQGEKQAGQQRAALRRQKQAEGKARSAAASERMAQKAELKQMQKKRRPDASAIMARARQKQMAGETFLTGSQGAGTLGKTRYLG